MDQECYVCGESEEYEGFAEMYDPASPIDEPIVSLTTGEIIAYGHKHYIVHYECGRSKGWETA